MEAQRLVSLVKWEMENPDELKGALLPSLYDYLVNEVEHKETVLTANEVGFPFSGRLLIAAHPKAPFRLVRDVLYTAGQAQFGQFGFLVDDPRDRAIVQQMEPDRSLFLPQFSPDYNTPPVLQKVQIPSQISVGDSVACQPHNIYDAEEDRVSLKYQWFVNGTPMDGARKSIVANRVNDQIQCRVSATDGMTESKSYVSNTVTVNGKRKEKESDIETLWLADSQVYSNCVGQYRLTIDPTLSPQLPSSEEKDIRLRGLSDADIFRKWSQQYHATSIAGHHRLVIFQSARHPLEELLTFASIWSSYNGSIVFPSGNDAVEEPVEHQPPVNAPSVVKPINNRYPVVTVQLPVIAMPKSDESAPNCIGKDGKRVLNHEGWSCNTLGNTIDCSSLADSPIPEGAERRASNRLRHADQLVFAEEQSCVQDEECILVHRNCCPCNSGGEQVAINQRYERDITDRRTIICPTMGCLDVVNEDPVCRATEARCDQGKCRVNLPQ